MSVLNLKNIVKYYKTGDEYLPALKGVSLSFDKGEFVSILGPSGCGKTTMLNIIGGLDRYSDGDLIIGGTSSKKFKASDWDAYRNHRIGFVFQSYNLISHQTVLQNVEISLSLSGISSAERKARAKKALEDVGLADQMKKKPSQLSGGQMQRVAVARALVNNPDIILADEPTGALDTQTSVNLMNLLQEIAKDKLVIMVTHNAELAEAYSTRIIKLLDGEVLSDSNPPQNEQSEPIAEEQDKKRAKSSMSFITALGLSFKNLLTKKGRTLVTSFAGSIGIISVALVLALSGGLTDYMGNAQTGALSGFPITISRQHQEMAFGASQSDLDFIANHKEYPEGDDLFSYEPPAMVGMHENKFTDEYFDFIERMKTELPDGDVNISYQRNVGINFMIEDEKGKPQTFVQAKNEDQGAAMMGVNQSAFTEMTLSEGSLEVNYDVIAGRLAKEKNEIVLVVEEHNAIYKSTLESLGLGEGNIKFSDILDKEIVRVTPNDDYYQKTSTGIYSAVTDEADLKEAYDNSLPIKVVGILRPKKDTTSLLFGFCYLPSLTDHVLATARNSQIANEQKTADVNLLYGTPFQAPEEKLQILSVVGADETPIGISLQPKDFDAKTRIKEYLDEWNAGKDDKDTIKYTDISESLTGAVSMIITVVSTVLIGFSSISLVVSTIMIGIITYISVLERTREIGILRAVGARKKDISRVFNAETLIVGLIAGSLGVGLAYLLSIPINLIISNFAPVDNICNLSPLYALVLVAGSMLLTLVAGTLPAGVASRKDPVAALRSE